VFHGGGDMHARGAGLADHLGEELGFPVDLAAVRGSGATPSRITLLRRRDNLAGKKVVIWCMSVREFTEGAQGWRPLQILR
jgi:alginate O-acetyltransferase complex protein AlgJ